MMTSSEKEKKSNGTQAPIEEDPAILVPLKAALRRPSPSASNSPTTIASTIEKKWNTSHLPWRVLSDFTAAASTAFLIAPIIASIDRAIIENASSRQTLLASLFSSAQTLILRPHTFLLSRPYRLIGALYFSTYMTANTVDTVSAIVSAAPAATTTSGAEKFIATTAVNMCGGLYKDSQFAQMFGSALPLPVPGGAAAAATVVRRSVPRASYAFFALRDSLTIFASFNLPPLVAPLLPLSAEVEKLYFSRRSMAQMVAPAGIQVFSTPLHLWGLDLYNRPGVPWRDRWTRVRRDWLGSGLARMGRIIPAFGIGGVVNARVRRGMMGRLGES